MHCDYHKNVYIFKKLYIHLFKYIRFTETIIFRKQGIKEFSGWGIDMLRSRRYLSERSFLWNHSWIKNVARKRKNCKELPKILMKHKEVTNNMWHSKWSSYLALWMGKVPNFPLSENLARIGAKKGL